MKKSIGVYMYTLLFFIAMVFIACDNGIQKTTPPPKNSLPPAQKIPAELHGVYEGKMMGTFPVFLTVTENMTDFFNARMPKTYTHMTYAEKGNGEWVVDCYNPDKKGEVDVTVTFDMKADPPIADIYIHPMGADVHCKKRVKKDPGFDIDSTGKILRGWTKDPNGADLEILDIPQGIVEIAAHAFKNEDGKYDKLSLIRFHQGVTKINEGAFADCTGLAGILQLPEKLEILGNFAFSGCEGLTDVKVPATVTRIGESAFSYCTALTKVDFSESTNLKYIDDSAFENCTELKQLNLPENLQTIGKKAFFKCGIEGVLTLPVKLKKIDDNAFQFCKKITAIDFSKCDELSQIGRGAFNHCTELTQVTLSKRLRTLGNCFTGCTKLATITVDPANKKLYAQGNIVYKKDPHTGTSLLLAAPALAEALNMPDELTVIEKHAFVNNQALKKVKFPANLTTIEADAFLQCSNLEAVDLTACTKLATIELDAFSGCKKAAFKVTAASGLKAKLTAAGVNAAQITEI